MVLEMFKHLGVQPSEVQKRIIVLTTSLQWAGGPDAPLSAPAKGFATLADFLQLGSLKEEVGDDGAVVDRYVGKGGPVNFWRH